jgi:hypothetical protein
MIETLRCHLFIIGPEKREEIISPPFQKNKPNTKKD